MRCNYPNVRKVTLLIAILFVAIGITIGFSINVAAQQPSIPSWIKNVAKLWGEGQVNDNEFINALQWLVSQGIIVIPSNQPTSHNTVSSQSVQQAQTGSNSLAGYFPTRDDVGTEWIINKAWSAVISDKINEFWFDPNKVSELYTYDGKTFFEIDGTSGIDISKISERSGFNEGVIKKYDKGYAIVIGIYRFNSNNDALGTFNKIVFYAKDKGGYKEEPVSSINGDNCYGAFYETSLEGGVVWCYKNNILFTFHMGGFNDDFTKMIEITANKIS